MRNHHAFYVDHPKCLLSPSGREWFDVGELRQARIFAQRLANELGKATLLRGVRKDRNTIETFQPAY